MVSPRTVSVGLPQESILSPFLFNMYISDYHQSDFLAYMIIIQYEDDFFIYTIDKNLETLRGNE